MSYALRIVLVIGCLLAVPGYAWGQSAVAPNTINDGVPKQLEGIGIEDKVGAAVPQDVRLTNHAGDAVQVGDYVGDTPLVVVLAYYECPMLCTLVLNGLEQGMKDLKGVAGHDFRVLVVSFDERDTPSKASAKRDAYLKSYGREVGPRGWDFTVGEPAEVRRLADSLGFSYRWDEETEQFAHGSGIFLVSPEGKLTRSLTGIAFPSDQLELALAESKKGVETPGIVESLMLFCYRYDPTAGSYVLATRRLMQAAAGLTVLALALSVLLMLRRERKRRPNAQPAES